jgi:hypothetical protein
MIFATSLPRFKAFLGDFSCKTTDWACCVLFITPFLLPACRRSVAAAARSVLTDIRDAGWMLRWLGSSSAPEAMLAAAQVQLLNLAHDSANRLHILILDSTFHGQQGKNTQNTIATGNTKKRATKSNRHQKKTHRHSGHCFVFALLLTPNGLRIPYWLPFFTKPHCEIFGRKHVSQASLAAQLVDSIPLPQGSRVVVVGDTAFEAKQIRQACARRGWQWVVPLNPERRLAGKSPRPKVRSLYEQLKSTDFRKVSIRLDQGELAAMARVSPSRSKAKKHERTYWVHHRTAAVHNVGEVALLFSRLTEPTSGDVKVQKLLISNAVTASTEDLLFFKEMKSELGMCQYKLGPFRRVEGWVNLSVVAFCYLEWYRWGKQQEANGKDKPFWQRLRTAGLKEKIRQQVQRAEIETLLALAGEEKGRERLQSLLDRICDDPAAAA